MVVIFAVLFILLAIVIALLVARLMRRGHTVIVGSGESTKIQLKNLRKMADNEFEKSPDREYEYKPQFDLELTHALIQRAPAIETMLERAPVCRFVEDIPHEMLLEPIDHVLMPVVESQTLCQLVAVAQFLTKVTVGSHYNGILALVGPVYFPIESLFWLFPKLRLLLINTEGSINTAAIKKLPPSEIINSADKIVVTQLDAVLEPLGCIGVFTDGSATPGHPFTRVLQRGGHGKFNLVPTYNNPADFRPWVIDPISDEPQYADKIFYYNLIIRPYGWYDGVAADDMLLRVVIGEYCNVNSISSSEKLLKRFARFVPFSPKKLNAFSIEDINSLLPAHASAMTINGADFTTIHQTPLRFLYAYKNFTNDCYSLFDDVAATSLSRDISICTIIGVDKFLDVLYYRLYGIKKAAWAADIIKTIIDAPEPNVIIEGDQIIIDGTAIQKLSCVSTEDIIKYHIMFKSVHGLSVVNKGEFIGNILKRIKKDYEITKCYMLSLNPLIKIELPIFDKYLFLQTTGIPTGLSPSDLVVFVSHSAQRSIKNKVMQALVSYGCKVIGIAFVGRRNSKYEERWDDIVVREKYALDCVIVDKKIGVELVGISKKYFTEDID